MKFSIVKPFFELPKRVYKAFRYLMYSYDQYEYIRMNIKNIKHCGKGTMIEDNVSISWPSRLRVGKDCIIQRGCILHSQGGIYIGDYVAIGVNSIFVSFSHNYLRPETLPYDDLIILKPIIVRDFVWIGFGVCIMPGVEIGEGAVIGMGSVVMKNVPPLSVVAGNPAKVIGRRNKEDYEKGKRNGRIMHPVFPGDFKEVLPIFFKRRYRKEIMELELQSNVRNYNGTADSEF